MRKKKKQVAQVKEIRLNTDKFPFLDAVTMTPSDEVTIEHMNICSLDKIYPQLIASPLMAKVKQAGLGCSNGYYNNTDALMFLSSVLDNEDCKICDDVGFGILYIEERAQALNSSLYTEIANTLSSIFSDFVINVKKECIAIREKYNVTIGDVSGDIARAIVNSYNYGEYQKQVSADDFDYETTPGTIMKESLLTRLAKRMVTSLAASSGVEAEKLLFCNTILVEYMNEISILINTPIKYITINRYIVNDQYYEYYEDDGYEYTESEYSRRRRSWKSKTEEEKLNIINELFNNITNNSLSVLHNEILRIYHTYFMMCRNSDYYNTVLPDGVNLNSFQIIQHEEDETLRYHLLNTELMIREVEQEKETEE